jgi:hypothetical protein
VTSLDNNKGTVDVEGVTRRRTLEEDFYGLVFDESSLMSVASRLKDLIAKLFGVSKPIAVSVTSDDGETLELGDNVELLKSPALPRRVGRVTIDFLCAAGPVLSARVFLSPTRASLTVVGETAIHASGLFSELKQELERHRYEFSWASRLLYRVPETVFTWAALALACWLWLFLIRQLVAPLPLQRIAELRIVSEVSITLLILLGPSIFGGLILGAQLDKAFPPVRFTGHFLDSSSRVRTILKRLWWAIIIPPIAFALRAAFPTLSNIFRG